MAATVGYDMDRITEEILIQAFGSVEAATATEEAAESARDGIDDWALTGCGHFCGRWPELRQALEETGDWLGWVRDDFEASTLSSISL